MIKRIGKITGILILIEMLLFAGLIAFAMTDEPTLPAINFFYWPLKHLFSFPMSILNSNYPFFLDTPQNAGALFCLSMLNNIILATAIWGIGILFRRKSE